ncbi:hypothetical protein DSO10_04655 [Listeria monocytogenes]|nr:hypothetical protein [Listeria monocytogenes]
MTKIEKLVNELQEECDKQDTNLVLSMIGPATNEVCFAGTGAGITLAIYLLNDTYKSQMQNSDCPCPICAAAREEMSSHKSSSEDLFKTLFGDNFND